MATAVARADRASCCDDTQDAQWVLPTVVDGVELGGRPVVILFARDDPSAPAYELWRATVSDDGVELVVRVGSAGREFAQAVGMPMPVDGLSPVGYAVVDPSRTVRYTTLDPAFIENGFEVDVITGAVE